MVLAERAAQVAAIASYGQNPAPGTEMFQGLFLNGVQSHGSNLAIIGTYDFTVFVFSGSAESGLPWREGTVVYTYLTSGFHSVIPAFRSFSALQIRSSSKIFRLSAIRRFCIFFCFRKKIIAEAVPFFHIFGMADQH